MNAVVDGINAVVDGAAGALGLSRQKDLVRKVAKLSVTTIEEVEEAKKDTSSLAPRHDKDELIAEWHNIRKRFPDPLWHTKENRDKRAYARAHGEERIGKCKRLMTKWTTRLADARAMEKSDKALASIEDNLVVTVEAEGGKARDVRALLGEPVRSHKAKKRGAEQTLEESVAQNKQPLAPEIKKFRHLKPKPAVPEPKPDSESDISSDDGDYVHEAKKAREFEVPAALVEDNFV